MKNFGLKKYAFMNQVFPLFEDISLWKSFYAAGLRISSLGVICLTGVFCFENFFRFSESSFLKMLGVAVFDLGCLVTSYMLVHLLWKHSYSVQQLDEEEYPTLRIFSHIARLCGELFAISAFGLGFSAGLTIVLVGEHARGITYGIGFHEFGHYSFLDGVFTMVAGMGYSVMALLAGRMLYELLVLTIDIAENIRKMRRSLDGEKIAKADLKHDRVA